MYACIYVFCIVVASKSYFWRLSLSPQCQNRGTTLKMLQHEGVSVYIKLRSYVIQSKNQHKSDGFYAKCVNVK